MGKIYQKIWWTAWQVSVTATTYLAESSLALHRRDQPPTRSYGKSSIKTNHLILTKKFTSFLRILLVPSTGCGTKELFPNTKSFGSDGELPKLIQDYVRGKNIQDVVNGSSSSEYPISGSEPQGSIIVSLRWNVYFNDNQHLGLGAHAYTDDCT